MIISIPCWSRYLWCCQSRHTIRYEPIVEGEAPMFTNMCLQTEIFKYSNLIKTKKKSSKQKTRKLSIYFWSNITEGGKWMRTFLSFVFVSVLNGTWGIEFSCGTVNCCLIEMSNIPSQNPIFPFIVDISTHQMNRMQGS